MTEEVDARVLQAVQISTQIGELLGPNIVVMFHPLTGGGNGQDVAVGSSGVGVAMLEAAIRTIAHVSIGYLKAMPACGCADCTATLTRLETIRAMLEAIDPELAGRVKH